MMTTYGPFAYPHLEYTDIDKVLMDYESPQTAFSHQTVATMMNAIRIATDYKVAQPNRYRMKCSSCVDVSWNTQTVQRSRCFLCGKFGFKINSALTRGPWV
jgi:hypothetical protein